MSLRSNLYRAGSLLGWAKAAQRGRLPERLVNVLLGRLIGRATRRLWR